MHTIAPLSATLLKRADDETPQKMQKPAFSFFLSLFYMIHLPSADTVASTMGFRVSSVSPHAPQAQHLMVL